MVYDNFNGESEYDLQVNCGILSIFPAKYDRVSKVSEIEDDYIQDEAAN